MNTNELYHHGIKGQKWGVRKYQNPDGSLTIKGAARLNRYLRKKSDPEAADLEETNRRVTVRNKAINRAATPIAAASVATMMVPGLGSIYMPMGVTVAAVRAGTTVAKEALRRHGDKQADAFCEQYLRESKND